MPPIALGEAAAREGRSVHGQVLPICFAGAQHRGDDAIVGAAAAEIAGQRLAHVGLGRLRLAVEQFLGRHDHAVDAVAALRGLLVDEGLLQRMRLVDRAEPFDGGDLGVAERADRGDAGAHRLAVDQHRAGAALREPAAELGAVERTDRCAARRAAAYRARPARCGLRR